MSDTPLTDERSYPADCLGKTLVVNAEWARELERENAALRADKERLDWLQNSPYWPHPPLGEDIRAAIDAARMPNG